MSISTIYELLAILLGIMFVYACYRTFDRHIFPMLVERKTKNIEKNPKWITPKLQKEYYGFKERNSKNIAIAQELRSLLNSSMI